METETTLTDIERYKLVISARNFHYENFNKWLTYFYVAMASVFVGYYTLLTNKIDFLPPNSEEYESAKYLIIFLGYCVSLMWYWSAKGYYFWNIHFITLVNHYEKSVLNLSEKERVYFVFANKKRQNNYYSPISGANVSTSKVAILFAFIIACFWGYIFINTLFTDMNAITECRCYQRFTALTIALVSVVGLTRILAPQLSSYIDHFPDLKIEHSKWNDQDEV